MSEVEHRDAQELNVLAEKALTDERVRLDDVKELRLQSVCLTEEEHDVLRVEGVLLVVIILACSDPFDML